MYESYWGLKQSPFSSTTGRQALAASPTHAEALARLDFLRTSGGSFGLLFGPAGSGKSAVLSQFAEQAGRNGPLVACANAAGAEESHVLPLLAVGLGISSAGEAATAWPRIIDRLEELKLEGVAAVVLLDDLDRAAASTLAMVERLLSVTDAPVTVVASARPESTSRLGRRLLEQASLRIDLTPWNEDETRDYLQTSLARAGRMQPAFNDESVHRLFELSRGAVRKVNQLAQLALVAGAGQKLVQIDAETIDAVEEELSVGR
jgi:general secretion pathway protein A